MLSKNLSVATKTSQFSPSDAKNALLEKTENTIETKLQLLTFSIAIGLLLVRLDGWKVAKFELLIQLAFLPQTILFLGSIFLTLNPNWSKKILETRLPRLLQYLQKLTIIKLATVIAFVFEVCAFGLLEFQNLLFAKFGYKLNLVLVAIVVVVIGGGFIWLLRQTNPRSDYFLYFTIVCYSLVFLLSIISFPLNPARSDMLPLITSANHNLLNGNNPYTIYNFGKGPVPLTYLPGNWLSYLPATLLGADPRLMNLIFLVTAALIVYFAVGENLRPTAACFLSIFLLSPYLQSRHDIYMNIYLLSLAATFALLWKKNLIGAALLFGWSLSVYQFSWVLAPFLLIYLFTNFSIKKLILPIVLAVLVALIIIGSFVLWSPSDFAYGVLTHWDNTNQVDAETINLSYFITLVLPLKYLQYFQAIVVLVILAFSYKKIKTLGEVTNWMTIAILAFALLNILVWTYFYEAILWLLTLNVFSVRGSVMSRLERRPDKTSGV